MGPSEIRLQRTDDRWRRQDAESGYPVVICRPVLLAAFAIVTGCATSPPLTEDTDAGLGQFVYYKGDVAPKQAAEFESPDRVVERFRKSIGELFGWHL